MTHDPREALEAERAELIAENEAATSWGAAVGARHERIKEIDRELSALTASAPNGKPEPVAWQIRCNNYCRTFPDGELEVWKQNWSLHLKEGRAEIVPLYTSPPPAADLSEREIAAQAVLARIRKVRDGYANQAKFADVDPACYFREFVRRLDDAVNPKPSSPPWQGEAIRREAPPAAGCPAAQLDAPHNSGERLPDSDVAEWAAGRPDAGGDVRVKPLEWDKHPDDDEWYSIDQGHYQISDYVVHHSPNSDGWCLRVRGHLLEKDYPAPESAKAAAQADYERRIISALSNPPAAVESNASAEARLREALEHVNEHWSEPLLVRRIVRKALSAGGEEAKKSEGGTFTNCASCDMPRTCLDHGRCFGPSDPADRREIVARPPPARVDYRKFMEWVGLSGPRPTNAELAFYLEIELGNREEVDAVEAAVLREAIAVLAALDGDR